MKKLSLVAGTLLLGQIGFGATADIRLGVEAYRDLTDNEYGESYEDHFDPGFSAGVEFLTGVVEDTFRFGLGTEYQSTFKGDDDYEAQSKVPVYAVTRIGVGDSSTGNAFYIPLKFGYSFNSIDSDTITEVEDGLYYAAGIGKQFTSWFNAEVLYEGGTYEFTNANGEDFDGLEHQVGVKFGLTLGGEPKRTSLPVYPAAPVIIEKPVVPEKPVVKAPTKEYDLTVVGSYFDFDDARLKPSAENSIRSAARTLKKANTDLNIKGNLEITGHTDSKGSDAYNQKLSERRAKSVADVYVDEIGLNKGIDFSIKGLGETYPVAPNQNANGSDNPEGRAQNRRVEVKFYPTQNTINSDGVEYILDVKDDLK